MIGTMPPIETPIDVVTAPWVPVRLPSWTPAEEDFDQQPGPAVANHQASKELGQPDWLVASHGPRIAGRVRVGR